MTNKKQGRPFGTTGAYKKECDKTKLTTFSLYDGEADLIRKYIKVIRKYKTKTQNIGFRENELRGIFGDRFRTI